MYMSVCRTVIPSIQPVWPIVRYVNVLLRVCVQCRTDMQLSRHVNSRKSQALFRDFPIFNSATLPVLFVL